MEGFVSTISLDSYLLSHLCLCDKQIAAITLWVWEGNCVFPRSADEKAEAETGGGHPSINECDHCGSCGERQEVSVEVDG